MPASSDGLEYLQNLKIGIDELSWLQEEGHRRRRFALSSTMLQPGFLVRSTIGGDVAYGWNVRDSNSDGVLELELSGGSLRAGDYPERLVAVAPDGEWLELYDVDGDGEGTELLVDSSNNAISVPDDGVWRTLVVRKATTQYAQGTIDFLTGSAVLSGTDTEFTRFSGYTTDGYGRGTRIYVTAGAGGSSNGNEGTYELDTITDDTNATMRTNANGTTETGVPFYIAGDFATTPPANPQIHNRPYLEWELVTRTVERPNPNDLIVADVMLDTGSSAQVQVIDRRHANLYRELPTGTPRHAGAIVQPRIESVETTPWTGVQRHRAIVGSPTSGSNACDLAPSGDNNLLAVVEDGTGDIDAYEYDIGAAAWQNPGGGGAVQVESGGSCSDPTIVHVPPETGNTHLCLYVRGGILRMRASTDNGATWGSESNAWDPTAVDASDLLAEPNALLLRSGRIIVAAAYYDDSAGVWIGRYIFSDDYGATWDTNTNVGHYLRTLLSGGDFRDPSICQAADGTLWCAYAKDQTAVYVFAGDTEYHFDATFSGGVNDTSDGTVVNDGLNTEQRDPTIFAEPHGNLVVLYTGWYDNASSDSIGIFQAIFGSKRVQASQSHAVAQMHWSRLWYVQSGTAITAQSLFVESVQDRHGVLHTLYAQIVSVPSELEHGPTHVIAMGQTLAYFP